MYGLQACVLCMFYFAVMRAAGTIHHGQLLHGNATVQTNSSKDRAEHRGVR